MKKFVVLILSIFISNFSYSERYDEMHVEFKSKKTYQQVKKEEKKIIIKAKIEKVDVKKKKIKEENQKALDKFFNEKN
ncbi:TPA: hypothetical protein QB662_002109 [Pasteurella multocida]|nr:hypothetical protein [Pasteurella multocida]